MLSALGKRKQPKGDAFMRKLAMAALKSSACACERILSGLIESH